MDLSDLEKRLLEEPKPVKSGPKPKPEKKPKKAAPAPEPVPAPAPVPSAKSSKYDLGGVEGKPKKVKAPKEEKPKVEKPKVSLPKPTPKPKEPKTPKAVAPKTPATKDSNAVPAGVALGAAPLVLAPIALLGAGRSVLSATKARRDKIQKEIEEFEAKKAKAKRDAAVDGAGLTTALVSMNRIVSTPPLVSQRVD